MFEVPRYKFINVHFSLLPKYRGASPVQHSILNGDKKTGITYYILDKGMDTGPILFQIEHAISQTISAGDLYSEMFNIASSKLPYVIKEYVEGKLTPRDQDNTLATYCWSKNNPKTTFLSKEDAILEWNQSVEHLYHAIRAYNPWPISWTMLQDLENNPKIDYKNKQGVLKDKQHISKKVKIYQASISTEKITPLKVQLEGKSVVDWDDFLNGYFN